MQEQYSSGPTSRGLNDDDKKQQTVGSAKSYLLLPQPQTRRSYTQLLMISSAL